MEEQIKALVKNAILLGNVAKNRKEPNITILVNSMTKNFMDLLESEKPKTCKHRWAKSVASKGIVCCVKCGKYKPEGV